MSTENSQQGSSLSLSILYSAEMPAGERLQRAVLFLSVSGDQPQSNGQLAVSLVIDRSYSMKLPMMAAARDAAREVLKLASPEVILGLVAFSDEAEVLGEPAACTAQHVRQLNEAIRQIEPGGGTRMSRALDVSLKRFARYPDYIKRILFLTDGKNTESRRALEQAVARCREQGVEISAWGLGTQWDEGELRYLADETGGTADLVLNPRDIGRAFCSSFEAMRSTAATDIVLRLQLEGQTRLHSLRQSYPYIRPVKSVADGLLHTAALGSLSQGEQRVCLVELEVPEDFEGVLARASAHYRSPDGKLREVEGKIPLVSRRRPTAPPHPVVSHYLRQEELARTAARGRQALEQGDRDAATRLLDQARRLSQETGNPFMTNVLTALLSPDQPPGDVLGTRKTLALHVGRTVLHDRTLEMGTLPATD